MKECQQRGPQNMEVKKSAKFLLKEIHDTLDIFGVLMCFRCAHHCSPRFIDTAEARHCDAEANQWKELLQATKHGTIQRIKIMQSGMFGPF